DAVQRRHRDVARRVLLRPEEPKCARRRGLSDGPRHAPIRGGPRGSGDPRCRAAAGRPGRNRALADACPRPSPRLVGAGVADAGGLIAGELFAARAQVVRSDLAPGAVLLRGFAVAAETELERAVAAVAAAA